MAIGPSFFPVSRLVLLVLGVLGAIPERSWRHGNDATSLPGPWPPRWPRRACRRSAQGTQLLKFIPQADLVVLDPIWTTATVTRNHAFLVFDTLYGHDAAFKAQPQMAAGAVTEDDGKTCRITLRDGLTFHDGTPVLARDCVASIRRWGRRGRFRPGAAGCHR